MYPGCVTHRILTVSLKVEMVLLSLYSGTVVYVQGPVLGPLGHKEVKGHLLAFKKVKTSAER